MAVKPKDASTVILVRDRIGAGEGVFEVLMVKRNDRLSFVPGTHVFPGGAVDDEDCDPAYEKHIPESTRECARKTLRDMPTRERALGAWIAAIRETFEEVGILFARKSGGEPLDLSDLAAGGRFAGYRSRLLEKKTGFLEMVQAEDITLSADSLSYFSHWITPEISPIRFDVRFFIALSPDGQEPSCDGSELTGQLWLSPAKAMEGFNSGRLDMVLPTLMTMEELSRFNTAGEAVASAGKRNIETILTKIQNISGRITETMPDGRTIGNLPPLFKR